MQGNTNTEGNRVLTSERQHVQAFEKNRIGVCIRVVDGRGLTAQGANGTWSDPSPAADWSNVNTASWAGGMVADGAGNTADFSTVNLPGDTAINVVDLRTIGNLIFGDTETVNSPASWTLSGNTITLAGTAPSITVGALGSGKSASIGDVIAGTAGLTKSGPGTLALTANNTVTGGVNVNGGVLDTSFSGTVLANQIITLAGGARGSLISPVAAMRRAGD